jgi:hypothetical protein
MCRDCQGKALCEHKKQKLVTNCTAAFADFHTLTTLTVSTTGRGVGAKIVVEVAFVFTENKDIGANGAGNRNKFMYV